MSYFDGGYHPSSRHYYNTRFAASRIDRDGHSVLSGRQGAPEILAILTQPERITLCLMVSSGTSG